MRLMRALLVAGLAAACLVAVLVVSTMRLDHLRTDAANRAHQWMRAIRGQPYVGTDFDTPFTCWGDSLTEGYNTTPLHDYPSLLSYVYHRPTVNRGIAMETSTQVKQRFLARPKVSGPEPTIIWAGRNNADDPDTILADIAAMVDGLNPGSPFLVIGITNADVDGERRGEEEYNKIQGINGALAARYGAHFLPIREKLVAFRSKRIPDERAAREDIPPAFLRSDDLHFNDLGQAIVAESVNQALHDLGY